MEKKKYRLFIFCFRKRWHKEKIIIKVSLHAVGKYADAKEARERLWHIAQKDLCGFFDQIFCLAQGNWKVMMFRFPEKRA